MPLHKTRPVGRRPCGSSTQSASGQELQSPFQPQLHPQYPANTDKSNQAAQMAQQLASQSSWADAFAPATPATTATPSESVADTQSQLDVNDPPPSYEAARLERELPPVPRATQENVRQYNFSSSVEEPAPDPPRDVEAGDTTPLLCHDPETIKARKTKQKRFVIVFLILAIWLMGIQCIKGLATGFWLADGTPIPPLPHRDYIQHETSTSISGTFTFYDNLELSTTSGSINIVIDPQISDKAGVIKVTSSTGSIKVKFSDEYLAKLEKMGTSDRIYDITIRSLTGSQSHELPLVNGGNISLTATTGSIGAKLYMAAHEKYGNATKLSTETTHGTQNIKVKAVSSEPITALSGQLYSKNSGTIKLNLPSLWQGMIHGVSGGSGSVSIKGDNLQFQRNGSKEVYAWRMHSDPEARKEGQVIEMKGDGSGSIKVDCSSS